MKFAIVLAALVAVATASPILHVMPQPEDCNNEVNILPVHPGMDVPETGFEQKPIFEISQPTIEEQPLFGIHPVDPIHVGVMPVEDPFHAEVLPVKESSNKLPVQEPSLSIMPVHSIENKLPVYEEEEIIVVQPIQKPDGQIAIMPIVEEHIVQIQPIVEEPSNKLPVREPTHSILPVEEPTLSIMPVQDPIHVGVQPIVGQPIFEISQPTIEEQPLFGIHPVEPIHVGVMPVEDPFHAEILPEKESAHKLPVQDPIHVGVQPIVGQPIFEISQPTIEEQPLFGIHPVDPIHVGVMPVEDPFHAEVQPIVAKPIFEISQPTIEEQPLFGIHPVDPIHVGVMPVQDPIHAEVQPIVAKPIFEISQPTIEEQPLFGIHPVDPIHVGVMPVEDPFHAEVLPVKESSNKLPVYEEEEIIVVQPIQKPDGQIAIMPIMEEHIVEIFPTKETSNKLPVQEPVHAILPVVQEPELAILPVHPGMDVPQVELIQKPIFEISQPTIEEQPLFGIHPVDPIHVGVLPVQPVMDAEAELVQKPIFEVSNPEVVEGCGDAAAPVVEVMPVEEHHGDKWIIR